MGNEMITGVLRSIFSSSTDHSIPSPAYAFLLDNRSLGDPDRRRRRNLGMSPPKQLVRPSRGNPTQQVESTGGERKRRMDSAEPPDSLLDIENGQRGTAVSKSEEPFLSTGVGAGGKWEW
jgi:hypothetical protein